MKVFSWVEWVCYVVVLASVAVVLKINWSKKTLFWWIVTFTIFQIVTLGATKWKCRVAYLEGFQDGEAYRKSIVLKRKP